MGTKTKKIVISTDMDDMGISMTIDGNDITKHFEIDMQGAIKKLLWAFDVSSDRYVIIDMR